MALIEWNQLSADLKTYGLLTGSLNISGSVNLDGDLLPAVAEIHDIGSTTLPFRDLYLTTGSLKFVKGGVVQATVSAVKEGIQVGNIKITTGSIDIVNNAGTTITTVAQASSSAGDVTGTETDPNIFATTGSFVATTNNTQITGSLIVSSDLTAGGNLTVQGTTTTIDTTNLTIEDKFAVFASGSTSATDGGLIISKQADGAGFALGYDSGTSRWGLDNDLAINATNLVPDSYIGVVNYSTSVPSTAPTYGGASNGYGAIHVETDTGDIYIYS